MPAHSPPPPMAQPAAKRARAGSPDQVSPGSRGPVPGETSSPVDHGHGAKVGQSSSFRNVSACNRCRLRKNKCDQKLPSCASCEKARVACVGYDPITKREIPRSYVYYLETRVEQLEALLRANEIQFPPAEDLEYCSRPAAEVGLEKPPARSSQPAPQGATELPAPRPPRAAEEQAGSNRNARHGATGGRRMSTVTNGVSFANVVFAAVQTSMSDQRSSNSDRGGARSDKGAPGVPYGSSMRDSFFGLHARPTNHPAPFPEREEALSLVNLFFQHTNPQIPILHREDFMRMFELAYATEGRIRGSRELYLLNMVFAIGSGIILEPRSSKSAHEEGPRKAQPEEYHASAIIHLDAALGSSEGGLQELQAVLLLANFALLRPIPPGLWYIVGVAVRLAVDLGLHYEDGQDLDYGLTQNGAPSNVDLDRIKEKGRREYVRDLRRRLWWCTYSFDRLVSSCVGRPLGVNDQVITTEFPSLFDDKYITSAGISQPAGPEPTYKIVAYHYFRLRLLQSEILQVLQFQQAQMARACGQNSHNPWVHSRLPTPFLLKYDSFRSWRMDIDSKLYEWKKSAPSKRDSGVDFSPEFLELNYWQAIIMLYRQSLSVPTMFAGEYNTSNEVDTPSFYSAESREDEERVYLKVAEAGQRIIRIYRQLHVVGLVNYTYLSTHHLFMAGISYLYAIWHSAIVRSRLSMDEVDFTILAATSVFSDLIEKCPPAEACRDAFDRTAKATIKMASTTGGFGPAAMQRAKREPVVKDDYITTREATINRHRHHLSAENPGLHPTPQSMYDIPSTDGGYASSRMSQASTQVSPLPAPPPLYRTNVPPPVKQEQEGFPLLRGMGSISSVSSSDAGVAPDNSAIDPSLLPSPGAQAQVQSPVSMGSVASLKQGSMAPSTTTFTPGTMSFLRSPSASFPTPGATALHYSDLQGLDFLQGLQGQQATGQDMNNENQMDLGYGLGWESTHNDFNDGQQQVDLFDGFFFGGQQGGQQAGGLMGGMPSTMG